MAHVMKTPSLVQWRTCCPTNPCAECIEVIANRQELQPSWHPRSALHLLQCNDYWLPSAELRDTSQYPVCADEPGTPASSAMASQDGGTSDNMLQSDGVPRPAADALRARITLNSKLMQEAAEQEDYLRAHALNVDKDKICAALSTLLGQTAESPAPTFVSLPIVKDHAWAKPGAHAYITCSEICQIQMPQTVVRIPVVA